MLFTIREWCLVCAAGLVLGSAGCSKGDRGIAGPPGPNAPPVVATGQNLNVSLTAARVTADRKVQVDYELTDANGAPVVGATDVSSSWTLAVLSTDPASNLPAWQALIFRTVTSKAPGIPGRTTQQPTSESNGTTDDLGSGNYRYTYSTALPDAYDPGATYRAAVYSTRPIAGSTDRDVANGILDFVPQGGTPQQHDLVSTQACNGCHGVLQAHGGSRRETRLCATCHTTQLFDPETQDPALDPTDTSQANMNPLDFGRLIHRIHRGQTLPTVVNAALANDPSYKYQVVGYNQGDNVYGATGRSFNPAITALQTTGVAFPQDLRNCAVCHSPSKDAQGNVQYGAQADEWKTAVSRRTCQGCHDSSWFASDTPPKYHVLHQQATNPSVPAGTNPATPAHAVPPGLPQADDSQCRVCHSDVLMAQHHTSPLLVASGAIAIKINSVTVTSGTAKVNFTVTNADGSAVTSLASPMSVSANSSGPTSDYSVFPVVTASASTSATPTAGASPGTYDLDLTLPPGATGTWGVGMEARRPNLALTIQERKLGVGSAALPAAPGLSPSSAYNEFALNPVAYFPASGSGATTPRRQVVTIDKCNACHGVLSLHGSLRHDPQYCVICHNPDATDMPGAGGNNTGRPPGTLGSATGATLDQLPQRTIHLKALVHMIHTGEQLQVNEPLVIYGFGQSPTSFDDVLFPGVNETPGAAPNNRANCAICHCEPGSPNNQRCTGSSPTFTVDAIPANALPTKSMVVSAATVTSTAPLSVATPGTIADVLPITAACLSCHDSEASHAHATANTVPAAGSAPAVETCAICHSETAEFAATKVHARFTR